MITDFELINILANFGFPIVMVVWFMFRTEKVIKDNTLAITMLTDISRENRMLIKELYKSLK